MTQVITIILAGLLSAAPSAGAAIFAVVGAPPEASGGSSVAPGVRLRIPGTTLRLGQRLGEVDSSGAFTPEPAGPGSARRRGPCRFFGLEGKATLRFDDGRLARASFELSSVPPHSIDYVQDQLHRLGYRRRCQQLEPARRDCEWSAATVIRLQVQGDRLSADVTAPEPAAEAATVATIVPSDARAAPPAPTPQTPERPNASTIEPPAVPPAAPPVHSPQTPDRPNAPTIEPPAVPPAAPPGHSPAGAGALAGDTVPVLPDTLVLGRVTPGRPAPVLLDRTALDHPALPSAARRGGVQGVVLVLATVDTGGKVTEARVIRSIPELDAASLTIARRLRFLPYTLEDRACRFRIVVPVVFALY